LDGLKKQYGDYFPQVLNELTNIGNLDPKWQVVANMTEACQAAGRVDLIRALQAQAAMPGGAAKLAETVPQADRQTIDKGLANEMAPYRMSATVPGESLNLPLINGTQEAVRTLAYSNVLKGQGGEDALHSAMNSVLNEKYDFEGTLRAPKGQMSNAQALTSQAQSALTAADIKPPLLDDPSLTPDQNAEIVATAAHRSGTWMATTGTDGKDNGARLLATLRNGAQVPVIRRDGTPVSVSWADLGKPNLESPHLTPVARAAGLIEVPTPLNVPLTLPHMPTGPDLGAWWRGEPK
jgi:hypothetical protein